MTKHRKPPAAWLHLHSGDMIHTTIPKHKIDIYLEVMTESGYHVRTEPTVKGYMLHCEVSPNDRPKPAKLKLVKG